MKKNIFRKKSIPDLVAASKSGTTLNKELGTWDLTLLGIGAIIGTGIFVLTGTGALTAGPALIISFIIAGLACLFAALSYAEFASTVPVSGSVYTYTYATMGEFVAWIIGWDLILEYLLAVSAVSVGWSGYFQSLLKGMGIHIPTVLTNAPNAVPGTTTYFNLPAFLIVMLITFLLSVGVKQSKRVNNIMVVTKVIVVVLFIVVAIGYVKPANWTPFTPFGYNGVFAAAALVFFAFIGFDAIASAAEETKNPNRDLPKGIMISLFVCTFLYVIVTGIMTGVVPFAQFKGNEDHPISLVLQMAGQDWVAGIVDVGAILGMTTVMLVMLYGQTRVSYAMARDGLLPNFFKNVHEKYRTPYGATWFFGLVAGLMGALIPLNELAKLVNIGTLSAFVLVSVAVIVLRKTQPDLPRAFKCPAVPLIPILAIVFCGFLMSQLDGATWIRFIIWLLIGVVIYFGYSKRHSQLNKEKIS
ncbi:amino acid transporter [Fictibacillus barbaricus]|uniref:APA family basic amino acid/polyamine antiporter n=1 Tax=Fictibacillus barbaricus TaxID=182136 RepID=A0ABU1U115_9BACL|nr:amino acid transporter [Fictibacillus barbaricus]MDR7073101.1 APA family basic amino acid/polyamine antiporter [Fictibacillus barbaricus]